MNPADLRSRRILVTALVLTLGGAAAHGQRPSGGGGGMSIDFTAVTADGKPVTDLTPADVTVKVGGKARTVTALTLKKVDAASAPAAPAAAAAPDASAGPSAPPFATNEARAVAAGEGRSFLIVVDAESLKAGTEPAIKGAIEGFLARLTAADRVAFSIAPRDTAQIGFGGPARVREAVANYKSLRPSSVSDGEAACRTQDTLVLLKALMQPLAGSETPTSVVFIAAELATPNSQIQTQAERQKANKDESTTCDLKLDHYQALVPVAAEARANFYVVEGDSAVGRDSGMENLAGMTGAGQVMRVAGDGFAPRVLADASAYWVATLAPDSSDRPGQSQRLELKAVREGVTVHSRTEVAMSRPAGAAAQPKAGTAASPKDMIATTAPFSDLQLRATSVVQRGAAEKMTVLVIAEPVDPTVKITALRVGFFDQAGKGASTDAPQIATYPIATALPLGVGQYRIRVAATDASGKSGAVDLNLNTALTVAGPLKLGEVILVAPRADGKLAPQLLFGNEEKITAMFELYGQVGPDSKLKIGFELAKSEAGAATGTFQPIAINPTGEPDKFQIVGEIPIAALAPGDYVIRGIAQMEGQPEGKVLRTFRKVAK